MMFLFINLYKIPDNILCPKGKMINRTQSLTLDISIIVRENWCKPMIKFPYD